MKQKGSINLFEAQRETDKLLFEASASGKMMSVLSLFLLLFFSMNFKKYFILKLKLNFN